MKERPILFSGPMVRAILDGKKVQTRRVMKPQPEHVENGMYKWRKWLPWLPQDAHLLAEHCPYGVPGDRLWVRETWRTRGYTGLSSADKFPEWHLDLEDWFYIHYRANNAIAPVSLPVHDALIYGKKYAGEKWRPSIFMPRWASRIMLEIIDVRVERVQDIKIEEINLEGLPSWTERTENTNAGKMAACTWAFAELWDSLNAKRGYGWDQNSWVWVIEFRRVDD